MKDIGTSFTGGILFSPTKWFFFNPCLCPFAVENSAAISSLTNLCSSALFPLSWSCFFYWWHLPSFTHNVKPRAAKSNHLSQQNPGNKQLFASLADQVQATDFGTALCQALSYLYKAFKELSAFFFLFYTVFPTLSLQLSLAARKCQVAAVATVSLQVQIWWCSHRCTRDEELAVTPTGNVSLGKIFKEIKKKKLPWG